MPELPIPMNTHTYHFLIRILTLLFKDLGKPKKKYFLLGCNINHLYFSSIQMDEILSSQSYFDDCWLVITSFQRTLSPIISEQCFYWQRSIQLQHVWSSVYEHLSTLFSKGGLRTWSLKCFHFLCKNGGCKGPAKQSKLGVRGEELVLECSLPYTAGAAKTHISKETLKAASVGRMCA